MTKQGLILILLFCAFLMLLLGLYNALSERIAHRGRIRSRLEPPKGVRISSVAELIDIRRSRGLAPDGFSSLSLLFLNKLIVQSGTDLGLPSVIAIALAFTVALFLAGAFAGFPMVLSLALAAAGGAAVPVIVLLIMRNRRRRRFEELLPEAIDTIVRGLRAGHAVSVAISSVGQNLSDPIGSEFRITAAEMTYGLDLETAMGNLYARVGQPDLGLVALAVSIQSKTGGNLAEVLSNLSRVIRERFKLRRRAIALASEGRFSALILSALPILVFVVLEFLSPHYYNDIWDDAYTKPVLGGALAWMVLGNYVINKMVNIRV